MMANYDEKLCPGLSAPIYNPLNTYVGAVGAPLHPELYGFVYMVRTRTPRPRVSVLPPRAFGICFRFAFRERRRLAFGRPPQGLDFFLQLCYFQLQRGYPDALRLPGLLHGLGDSCPHLFRELLGRRGRRRQGIQPGICLRQLATQFTVFRFQRPHVGKLYVEDLLDLRRDIARQLQWLEMTVLHDGLYLIDMAIPWSTGIKVEIFLATRWPGLSLTR